jgi:hypothetical protein
MVSSHIVTVLLFLLGSSSSKRLEKICKVICHFKRLNYAEISMEKNADKVKLSKGLASECSISTRYVESLNEFGTHDLIAFTYHEVDKKENL